MKRNLYTLIPNPTDGTSLYRGWGPLARIREHYADLNYIVSDRVDWSLLINCDAVFLQRPFSDAHLRIAEMAKNMNLKIWIDYDDDLLSVPRSNPTYENYSAPNIQKNVVQLIAMADEVSVSTEPLAKTLDAIRNKAGASKCEIIPNAIDLMLFKDHDERTRQRHRLAVWRGSATHDEDIMMYERELVTIAHKFPDVLFQFIGKPFWKTIDLLSQRKNVQSAKGVDPIEYFSVLKKIQPLMMFVPLKDCQFNRAKSNIAWIEASYAGAVALAPDWEEWQRPGTIRYKASTFLDSFSAILSGDIDTQAAARESWAWICDNLDLQKVNKKRLSILRKIFER